MARAVEKIREDLNNYLKGEVARVVKNIREKVDEEHYHFKYPYALKDYDLASALHFNCSAYAHDFFGDEMYERIMRHAFSQVVSEIKKELAKDDISAVAVNSDDETSCTFSINKNLDENIKFAGDVYAEITNFTFISDPE